jgi:hypothetical protein
LRPEYRLVVEEPDDARMMQALFERVAAPGKIVTTREAIERLDQEPELPEMNARLQREAKVTTTELDRKIAII